MIDVKISGIESEYFRCKHEILGAVNSRVWLWAKQPDGSLQVVQCFQRGNEVKGVPYVAKGNRVASDPAEWTRLKIAHSAKDVERY